MNLYLVALGLVVLITSPILGPLLPFSITALSTNITNLAVTCPQPVLGKVGSSTGGTSPASGTSLCTATATVANKEQTITGAITINTNIYNYRNQIIDLETQDVTIAYGTSATVTQALSTPLIAGTYKVNMFVTVQGTAASNSETANFNAGAYLLTLDSCGTGCDQNLSPSPAVYAEAVGSSVPIAFTGTPSQWAISCWIVISYSPNQYIHNICNSGSTSVGPASFSLAMDSSKEVIPQIAPASTFGFINITPDLASETPIGIGVFQPNTAQSVYASGLTCSNGSACPTAATFSVSN